MRRTALTLALAVAAGLELPAQSTTIPGMDARMIGIDGLVTLGRTGAFPGGRSGLAFRTMMCNTGTVPIEWLAPMDPRHPFFAFILCRESNGRFEQISDRSFVKHGRGAANRTLCGPCQGTVRTQLAVNCSDTYTADTNGDRHILGPADEIDPWLCVWQPLKSHFDRGEPDVGLPLNCDGQRSLTREQVNRMDPVTHRIEVDDADLRVGGARFFYGGHVVVPGEAEALRDDNLFARETSPKWNGSWWGFADVGPGQNGSILQLWTGATVTSGSNGGNDGRFYVAVRVTGPDARGLWHYEYAVHNRDNSRGAASLRVPICASARVMGAGARDIDGDPTNDWSVSVAGGEVAFLAGAGNALEWNTIYNFWFDSDAAPRPGSVGLDQARPGSGAARVTVPSTTPGAVFNVHLGDGCGVPSPTLAATGQPPRATIPNPTFALQLSDLQPGGASVALLAGASGSFYLGNGCTLFLSGAMVHAGPITASAQGTATLPLRVPGVPALEGLDLFGQVVEVRAGGPLLGQLALSNGLAVRVGNQRQPCP